jgi:hypothetical protein
VPVLTCPKCPTKLKVPDGVSGNTRCPKCGTVFPVIKPAFEVVEDEPAPQPPPRAPAPKPAPATKPKPLQPDFEVIEEEPKKRRARDDDDDEEDRPRSRKKRARDDDDDDDRPRKKKKKKRYADDESDDDWQPHVSAEGAAFAKGKAGALVIGISFWLNLAAYGLLALYTLIAWLLIGEESSGSSRGGRSGGGDGDGSFLDVIVILPGLIGLGAWLVGLIGCSIAIAGPRKAKGMAITATVFAALHLLFVGITFGNMQDGIGIGRSVPGLGKAAWIAVASTLPALDAFLPMLFYQSKAIGNDYVIALVTGAFEAARLIVMLFALKSLAAAARDYDASERSGYGVMIVTGVMGGIALIALFVVIVLVEGKFTSPSTYANLGLGTVFLMYLGYTLMMLSPAIAAMATKDACARRA